jgi:uncharacterized membrane protein
MFPGIVQRAEYFAGPMPSPATMKAYEDVLPGLAEKIVAMALDEGKHRRRIELGLLRVTQAGVLSAFILALTLIVGAIFLLHEGRQLGGLAALVLAVGSLVGAFIIGKHTPNPVDQAEVQE